MNEGWLNYGGDYVIVPYGKGEQLGLVLSRYDERAVVRVLYTACSSEDVSFPVVQLRPASRLEIYEYGEMRLKWQPLGPEYGADAERTMWDLMTERDREYWRALRPKEEQ